MSTFSGRGALVAERDRSSQHEGHPLENVLQRELQDSRVKSRTDLSESVAVQGGRIADRDASTYGGSPGDAGQRTACCALYAAGPEAIRHIKCFDSNFKPLCLANVERSGQRHIEGPRAGADQTVPAHVAIRTQCRHRESRRINPLGPWATRSVLVDIRRYLIGPLKIRAAQRHVYTGNDVQR